MSDAPALAATAARPEAYYDGPMWSWFSLSYAGYLVVPRVALCSMPADWQARMVTLLDEMNGTIDWDGADDYSVSTRSGGRFATDPLASYKYPPAGAVRFKEPLDG